MKLELLPLQGRIQVKPFFWSYRPLPISILTDRNFSMNITEEHYRRSQSNF